MRQISSTSIDQKLQKYNSLERKRFDSNIGLDNVSNLKNYQMTSEVPTYTPNSNSSSAKNDFKLAKTNSDSAIDKITIPPLNTKRLLPKRHKTRDAIMSILGTGEVVIEFIKYQSHLMEDRIVEVCKISNDGLRIVLFKPSPGQ